jgi:hypothetical protein
MLIVDLEVHCAHGAMQEQGMKVVVLGRSYSVSQTVPPLLFYSLALTAGFNFFERILSI